MGRIRTIKPEFWQHEDLSDLSEAAHMLAAALLNYADDEGYFNANPLLIKAACFPLREPSSPVPVSLQELSRIGYLRLGIGADSKRYGQIVNFCEHQVISHKKDSKIKDVGIAWEPSSPVPVIVHPEGKGMEQGIEGKGIEEANASSSPGGDDTQSAVKAFNEIAAEQGWSQCQRLTKQRKASLNARLRSCGGIEGWKMALARARDAPWLNGESPSGWRVDFDFLIRESKFTKLMEGGYDDKRPSNGSKSSNLTEKFRRATAILDAESSSVESGPQDRGIVPQHGEGVG